MTTEWARDETSKLAGRRREACCLDQENERGQTSRLAYLGVRLGWAQAVAVTRESRGGTQQLGLFTDADEAMSQLQDASEGPLPGPRYAHPGEPWAQEWDDHNPGRLVHVAPLADGSSLVIRPATRH